MAKLELNNTTVEDVAQQIKTLGSKYSFYKTTSEKFEANIREQLDIIHSLNAKINSTKDD
jgi:archaellum component FlaC